MLLAPPFAMYMLLAASNAMPKGRFNVVAAPLNSVVNAWLPLAVALIPTTVFVFSLQTYAVAPRTASLVGLVSPVAAPMAWWANATLPFEPGGNDVNVFTVNEVAQIL